MRFYTFRKESKELVKNYSFTSSLWTTTVSGFRLSLTEQDTTEVTICSTSLVNMSFMMLPAGIYYFYFMFMVFMYLFGLDSN